MDAFEATLADLLRSGLTAEDLTMLKISILTGSESLAEGALPFASYRIPYHNPDGTLSPFYRLRYIETKGILAQAKKTPRYHQPGGTLPRVYFAPYLPWVDILGDSKTPLLITEGEKKAALACKLGVPTLGLGGVFNFLSSKHNISFLPDLEAITWADRQVCIVFDSDGATNSQVSLAGERLAHELLRRGAIPQLLFIPGPPKSRVGLDDYLVANKFSVPALAHLIASAPIIASAVELLELSEEVLYVREPGAILVRVTHQIMTPSSFVNHAYSNRWFVEGKARLSTAQAFLDWERRPEVKNITYAPGESQIVNDGYNTWSGWGATPKRGSVKPFTDLVDYAFDDLVARKYFLQWCAYPIQHPGVKMQTAVVLWSVERGTGKSLLAQTLCAVHGAANSVKLREKDLHGAFNWWAKGKTFIYGEEITGKNKADEANYLKDLISQKTVNVNEKYVPEYVLPDRANWMFLSNHGNALLISDKERRFLVQEIKANPLPTKFYDEYADVWLAGEGPSALLYHLQRVSLEGFNPFAHAPITHGMSAMVEAGRTTLQQWLSDVANGTEGALPADVAKFKMFTFSELLMIYRQSHPLAENWQFRSELPNYFFHIYRGLPICVCEGTNVVLWTADKALVDLPRKEVIARYCLERGLGVKAPKRKKFLSSKKA